ncbi:MAG TPA: hypothetical protein VJT84_09810 [Gaiellaceae bacterium]|nr:hypothetical protein [Gaiellaceae bacterium]
MALHAPQLIVGARMLYLVWLPADPDAAAALVPDELEAAAGSPVFMNQYVVDDAGQTSNAASEEGFGAYSLTYLGVDLAGLDTEDGTPGRWWTHYFDSSENMIRYAAAHGVPAGSGETELDLDAGGLVATTVLDGEPAIRTTARVELGTPGHVTGQLRYVTRVDGQLVSGRYPFVMDAAETFQVESVDFLGAGPESLQALRPADPLHVTFGFYSPSISFCYPGGEGPLGSEHGS